MPYAVCTMQVFARVLVQKLSVAFVTGRNVFELIISNCVSFDVIALS